MADKKNQENKEKQEKKEQKGIPIDNENVSNDPNKSPKGAEKDKNVNHHHEDYVEPYNRQKYQDDPKKNKR